jgi:hypothetical protein
MKKLIFTAIIGLLIWNASDAQVKMRIRLMNPCWQTRYGQRLISFLVIDSVYAGQTFRVGSCNPRWDIQSTGAVVRADTNTTAVSDRDRNLSPPLMAGTDTCGNNNNYGACMTTTSILGGAAISMNITRNGSGTCYRYLPGVHYMGRIRFVITDSTQVFRIRMRVNSVFQDSITQWVYGTDWTADTSWFQYNLSGLPQCAPVGIEFAENLLPTKFELYQNFPNPFNAVTAIKYDIPRQSFVTIMIYDLLGREVKKLVDENKEPGRYEVKWDAINNASGTYFYRLETDNFVDIKKMILVK